MCARNLRQISMKKIQLRVDQTMHHDRMLLIIGQTFYISYRIRV